METFSISGGHNPNGKVGCGTVNKKLDMYESTEDRYITNKVIEYLKKDNRKAYNCTVNNGTSQGDVLDKLADKHNDIGADWDISIHFNDVNHKDYVGDGATIGTEVWYYSGSKHAAEIKEKGNLICSNISKIGFRNRGVKAHSGLRFLKETHGKSMIIEVCFCCDKDDVTLYKANRDNIAKAIADALQGKVYNPKKEVKDVDKIVLYHGDADVFAAIVVAQKHKCPMMKESDFKISGLKAKEVVQIGGKSEDANRFQTFKNAAKLL